MSKETIKSICEQQNAEEIARLSRMATLLRKVSSAISMNAAGLRNRQELLKQNEELVLDQMLILLKKHKLLTDIIITSYKNTRKIETIDQIQPIKDLTIMERLSINDKDIFDSNKNTLVVMGIISLLPMTNNCTNDAFKLTQMGIRVAERLAPRQLELV